MSDKLKPCPFCGREIDFNNAYEDGSGNFIPANIYCPGCGVIMAGGYKKLKYDDKGRLVGGWLTEEELNEYDNELAEKWNNRRYVPEPHGRLIDADDLITAFPANEDGADVKIASVRGTILHAPTVIEAEDGKDS